MKKFISVVIVVLLTVLPFSQGVFAAHTGKVIDLSEDDSIEYFDDGSYLITSIHGNDFIKDGNFQLTSSQSITFIKTNSFYDAAHKLQWVVTLEGRFTYNGVTSNCFYAAVYHEIHSSKWKVTTQKVSKSGSTAYGEFVVKRYTLGIPVQTVNLNPSITCPPNGVIS